MASKIEIEQLLNLHFAQLSELHDKHKSKSINAVQIKSLERKLSYLEEQIHTLQRQAVTYNATVTEKKELVNLNNCESALHIVDILYSLIYASSANPVAATEKINLPLPNLQLPIFEGHVETWSDFKELFELLVDSNNALTDLQKFSYLRSQLKREPLSIISSYDFTEANYKPAYAALKHRYDSTRRHASFTVKKLFASRFSSKNIPQALESLRGNINNLKKINVPDLSDYLLFELAYNSCDEFLQKSFDNAYNKQGLPTTSNLIGHLEGLALNQEIKFDAILNTDTCSSNKVTKPLKSRTFVTRSSSSMKCPICSESHLIYKCNKFLAFSVQQRFDAVKKNKLCFNCLSPFHDCRTCKSTSTCSKCKKTHHTLLHFEEKKPAPVHDAQPHLDDELQVDAALACTSQHFSNPYTLLGTVVCFIRDAFGIFHEARCLLDNASQRSLVSARLIKRLGLEIRSENRTILGIDSASRSLGTVSLHLCSRLDKNETLDCHATVLSKFCEDMPSYDLSPDVKVNFSNIPLADENFFKRQPVDILLGAIEYASLLSQRIPNVIKGKPSAIRTRFGWSVFGCTSEDLALFKNHALQSTTLNASYTLEDSLNNALTRFWEIEEIHTPVSTLSPEEVYVEEHFLKTHSRNSDGSFTVRLPFCPNANPDSLNNRERSLNCYTSLERRLNKTPELKLQYTNFMEEFISMGHMKVAKSPANYVMSHHCVLKPDSSSTKLRCVFNASSKDIANVSLNDLLLPGPKLQSDVDLLLLRFRFHNIALTTDITKFYRMIYVHPDDRKHQRLFYRPNAASPVLEYEINRLVYGMTPSSFLAQRTLKQLVAEEGQKFPLAASAILNDTLMDDCISGASDIASVRQLRDELITMLGAGGFSLSKWSSSHEEVFDSIHQDYVEKPLTFSGSDAVVKVLGLCWLPKQDVFSYRVIPFDTKLTKRSALSYLAKWFDPLGLACPVFSYGKQLIQNLWLLKVDWDDPTPEKFAAKWNSFVRSLDTLSEIRIPRSFHVDASDLSLIGFCDASETSYAAVVYLRVKSTTTYVHLMKAKSRVAPLKSLSIPRLELLGAKLLSELVNSIIIATPSYKYRSVKLFCDSQVVLAWLKLPIHSLQTFVANRVSQIVDLTSNYTWSWIRTDLNPADCATRPITATELKSHPLWWNGPGFLLNPEDTWNEFSSLQFDIDELPELKKTETALLGTTQQPQPDLMTLLERYSTFSRAQRVLAYVLRFIHNLRNTGKKKFGQLSVEELNNSTWHWIRSSQISDFFEELQHLSSKQPSRLKRFTKLSPFLDDTGLIRVGGRLSNSNLSFTAKHPVLLAKNNRLSALICDYYHRLLLHAGPRTTQAFIQRHYWILSLRSLLRSRIHLCRPCFRLSAQPSQPEMAGLPANRVTCSSAFAEVMTDFAGPFTTKETTRRSSPRHRSYLCLFICMYSKAVHLETVSELSTEAFMNAFHRFVSRRSLPMHIYSDCGRNYVGAARHLKEVTEFLKSNHDNIYTSLASLKVSWHFSPPYAPNFNGLVEAGVRIAKSLLYKQIGQTTLTFEQLSTLFCRIEAVMNSRILIPLSADPNDGVNLLTPAHLLLGRPLVSPPEPILNESDVSIGSQWKRIQALAQQFWKRFQREYLHTLIQKNKWTTGCPNLQVGQLVYITDMKTTPLNWPIGIIEKIHPSKDNIVRVCSVRSANGQYIRAANKLIVLPSHA